MCEDAPLLGPLPAPASQGEDEKARSKNFAEKSHILMDPNTTRFQPFNTRLIVRKGCVDSSKIRSGEPKLPAPDSRMGKPGLPGEFHLAIVRHNSFAGLKIIVAITGASGALYAQRLLDNLDPRSHDIHLVSTSYGQAVIAQELPDGLRLPAGAKTHNVKSMNAPFASGSNAFDAMVVIPCSMGTLGRIAHGTSEDLLLRAADVMLKERRKLILVPRETPLNLVHVKNFELLLQAGATILPANPCFYTRPKTIEQVVDTVVARVLDHLGVPQKLMPRWQEEKE